MRRCLLCLSLVFVVPLGAAAQDSDEIVVPPPPGADVAPEPSPPAQAPPAVIPPAPTGVGGSLASPSGAASPAPVPPSTAEPLLEAAEQDLAGVNVALAAARLEIALSVLVPNSPLYVRAQALQSMAASRSGEASVERPPEQVVSPLIMQAERDLAAGQPALAHARATLAMAHLPENSPLRARAQQITVRATVVTPASPLAGGDTPYASQPYPSAAQPSQPYRYERARRPEPPADPSHRGTGEIVELYITAGLFGVGSGIYLTHAASDRAEATAYTLTSVGGGAVMAASVLLLDLTDSLETGMAPAISTGIRGGFAFGMTTTFMLAELDVSMDAVGATSLIWGGAALGLVTGAAVGFGLNPSVRQVRFIESTEIWGLGLGVGIAMLTEFQDAAGPVIMFSGLSAGMIAGLSIVGANAEPSTRRSLFLDLGFLAGAGVGAAISGAVYVYGDIRDPASVGMGAAILAGSVAGWGLLFGLTHGMDDGDAQEEPNPERAEVRLGMSPVEGGGVGTLYGQF